MSKSWSYVGDPAWIDEYYIGIECEATGLVPGKTYLARIFYGDDWGGQEVLTEGSCVVRATKSWLENQGAAFPCYVDVVLTDTSGVEYDSVPRLIPEPVPECECTDWVDGECVSEGWRRITRECYPDGCMAEEDLRYDPECGGSDSSLLILGVLSVAGLCALFYL